MLEAEAPLGRNEAVGCSHRQAPGAESRVNPDNTHTRNRKPLPLGGNASPRTHAITLCSVAQASTSQGSEDSTSVLQSPMTPSSWLWEIFTRYIICLRTLQHFW